jgi:galactokinase
MNQALIERLKSELVQRYGGAPGQVRTFYSPSRINIIGEHVDYNGGTVFPCAISVGTYAAARPNDRDELRLFSINLQEGGTLRKPFPPYEPARGWLNYVCGTYLYLADTGAVIGGLDAVIEGDIPNGSGLSSSASLEMLLVEMQNHFYNNGTIDRMTMIKAGISCENDYIGIHTGVMDQSAIALGKKDHALLLNTDTMDHRYIPFELGDYTLVIMNTRYRRELKDSAYNLRRAECEEALADLQKFYDVRTLCDVTAGQLDRLQVISSPAARKRARHVITENARVFDAVTAMQNRDIIRLGQILRAGDDSMREYFEATGPHLDALTGAANKFPDCVGARMTGGGFGGCAIALVHTPAVKKFCETVGAAYTAATGLTAEFILSGVEDGTKVLPN